MANLLSTNVSGRLYTSGHVDTNTVGAAFRFYDGSTFRGGLGLDDWAHSGSANDITLYVANDSSFYISTSGTKRAQFSSSAAIFRTYSPNTNYNIRITGGDQFNAYIGDTATTLYINWNGGATRFGGELRAPIFYDSDDTTFYVDPNNESNLAVVRTALRARQGMTGYGVGNWVSDFSNTPVSSMTFGQDKYDGGPAGSWWFQVNMRHNNPNNLWGTQLAYGWEDNANEIYQRNVTGGDWSGWVRYINTNNYSGILDGRYYTESEVDSLLSAKQNASTAITTSNIGSQSVSYATSAGNADTVDGYHASAFTQVPTWTSNTQSVAKSGFVDGGNWYRIADLGGQRFFARVRIYDDSSGGPHSSVEFQVAGAYNQPGSYSFTLTSNGFYSAPSVTQVRMLSKGTYDSQYLEVYISYVGYVPATFVVSLLEARNASVVNWEEGSVPDGYSATTWLANAPLAVGGRSAIFNSGIYNTSDYARFGNVLVGQGTYKNIIKPIDDANLNIHTPSGALYLDTYAQASGSFRAPIFYDSNDTGYYADFNATGNAAIRVRGGMLMGPNPTWGAYLQVGGDGNNGGSYANVVTTNGNLHLDSANGYSTYINHYYGGKIYFGSGGAGGGLYYHSNFSAAGNLHIGGADADASYRLQVSGTGYATSDFRAPIFYDSENTDYYLDPNYNSRLLNIGLGGAYPDVRLSVSGDIHLDGYIYQGGAAGNYNSWGSRTLVSGGNYVTNANSFRFDNLGFGNTWYLGIDSGGAVTSSASFRAPIFYDSQDTTYYCDPNGYSSFWGLAIRGDQAGTSGGNQIFFWGAGNTTTSAIGFKLVAGVWAEHGATSAGYNTYFTMDTINRGWIFRRATVGGSDWTGVNVASISNTGHAQFDGSVRSPIFYDSDDTNYYLNPTSTGSSLVVAGYTKSKFTYRNNSASGLPGQDNPVKTATGVLATLSGSGGGNEYIIIKTRVPQDSYQMGGFTIDLFANYGSTNAKTTISLGGYWNPENNNGFEGWEYNTTNPNVYPPIQVMRDVTDGSTCFAIQISKSYPIVVARDLYLGYNSADIEGWLDWSIFGADDLGGYTNNDTVVCRNALPADNWYGNSYIGYDGAHYGTIFLDSADTSYYLDPNSTSRLHIIKLSTDQWNQTSDGYNRFYFGNNARTYFGSANGYEFRSAADANIASISNAGDFVAAGDVTAYSDARIKENVHTIENALDKTLQLRGVTYNRTDSEDKSTKVGVIAQEILEVIPEVVKQNDEGMYSVSYGNLTAVLIEAIKEQQKQIDELKEIINGLTK